MKKKLMNIVWMKIKKEGKKYEETCEKYYRKDNKVEQAHNEMEWNEWMNEWLNNIVCCCIDISIQLYYQ